MKRQGIIGIYLAAGESERFVGNKLLQNVGGNPLGSLALKTALESRLDKVIVVTKEQDDLQWASPLLASEKLVPFTCVESAKGQSYSLKCGLQHAEQLGAEAVVVLLADQPFISNGMINTIIDGYTKSIKTPLFVAARRSGIPCPPILFAEDMFTELYQLHGDKGARYLIRERKDAGLFIDFTDPLLFFDVDTEIDYESLIQKYRDSPPAF